MRHDRRDPLSDHSRLLRYAGAVSCCSARRSDADRNHNALLRFASEVEITAPNNTLDLDDAITTCDGFNRRLGNDREAWTAMAAVSMLGEDDDLEGGGWNWSRTTACMVCKGCVDQL